MGIEFHLGRNDHKVVEDFLAAGHRVVDGVTLDAHNVERQRGAIEAAQQAGVPVRLDLLLERLTNPGFDYGPLSYVPEGRLNKRRLRTNRADRSRLVEESLDFQQPVVSQFVAPHFFTADERDDETVVALAEETLQAVGSSDVRVVVAANRDRLDEAEGQAARVLAEGLATVGVSNVELRLSPTGDRDMSLAKLRSIFDLVELFEDNIDTVVLGYQGIIGPAAIAAGLTSAFSVGVGLREKYDYSSLRQPRSGGDNSYGPQPGVYLPAAGSTVTKKMAVGLYKDPDIRSRLRCPYSCCKGNIEGPATDPRAHYLHSRASQLTEVLDKPIAWRGRMEQQRLQESLDTAVMINDGHVPKDCHPIKTRTLRSLIEYLEPDAGADVGLAGA
jgi:hypothetical protein